MIIWCLVDHSRFFSLFSLYLTPTFSSAEQKNFMDLVPKACMHFLVLHFKESLQNELVAQLYQ